MDRKQLISKLKEGGFSSNILNAFKRVQRAKFIPDNLKEYAYEDIALPLEQGATISQPYTIAFMLNLLELRRDKKLKILEIGSGCGYVLALLYELTKGKVYGVEIIKSLAEKSSKTLSDLKNKVTILNENGYFGMEEKAPFDRILVSASGDKIPENLYEQLKDKGILVIPVKESIFKIKKVNKKLQIKEFPGFVFVPLTN